MKRARSNSSVDADSRRKVPCVHDEEDSSEEEMETSALVPSQLKPEDEEMATSNTKAMVSPVALCLVWHVSLPIFSGRGGVPNRPYAIASLTSHTLYAKN